MEDGEKRKEIREEKGKRREKRGENNDIIETGINEEDDGEQ
jgi:hypothetical protein